jgi:hypothetical protein
LIYEKLPRDIANRHVLLLDPVLATGQFFSLHESLPSFVLVSLESWSSIHQVKDLSKIISCVMWVDQQNCFA